MNQAKTSGSQYLQFALPLFDNIDDGLSATATAMPGVPVGACSAGLPEPTAITRAITVTTSVATVAQHRSKPVEPAAVVDVDDHRSENYRFRDAGYVAGSRKEQAASAVILRAKRDGSRVHVSLIDWDELESNPREAKNLVTKSNFFGEIDWAALRAAGIEPGAAFLIDRIYAAIAQEPSIDAPDARKDYATGLQILRDRLEATRKTADVVRELAELWSAFEGAVFTPEEASICAEAKQKSHVLFLERQGIQKRTDEAYQRAMTAKAEVYPFEREIEVRQRRGWKAKPELQQKLDAAEAEHKRVEQIWSDLLEEVKPRRDEIDLERRMLGERVDAIVATAKDRNKRENAFHRALNLFGDRFVAVLRYRSTRYGSDAFAKHVAVAEMGKIADWEWMEKEVTRAPRATSEAVRFQLRVADSFEREGGRQVIPQSTVELKELYKLRAVQSGNWVLRDFASGKFHTEQSGAAFADLADLLGVPDSYISLGGKLALAFGARGNGAKGWKNGAAAAHWESVHRVINITKVRGGGALGHEWFHGWDNLITEIATGQPSGVNDFASANPDILPAGKLRDAMRALYKAMKEGPFRATVTLQYSSTDVKHAARVMERASINGVARMIRDAGNVHAAVQAVDEHLGPKSGEKLKGRNKTLHADFRAIAIAHYGGNPDGGEIEVQCGPTMSSFALEAHKLDQGGKPYYTEPYEMAARAFQSWIEDRLAALGRKNDYLSVYAANRFHKCPLTGMDWKPFPEGKERERINAAFDTLASAIRESLVN
ncbi:LPD1 domain-containing protein [Burkholderia sp. Ac-20365]|uniref:LPD1 domain-containing protein n=1 Tax=Burkholderia sp. Ac-20365 TaxID=2703897 RepID=UPI00197C3C20|nr:LPD1 domain-containing protein [Burkholderia sp. Ac-20365]MBN3761336.1 hypothetical protein [Burkholderia sp. Ac-20365]